MKHGSIIGWGKYLPEKVITNEDLSAQTDTSDAWIQERTGIKERHVVAADEHCSDMAAEAGRRALAVAKIAPTDLDLIIVATSSPDHLTPPVSSQVQALLGATDVGAFTMVVGCTGFVYALVTAQQFIASGAAKRILIVGVELISRMLDWTDRNTCVLFGDGAGAVVMEATDEPCGVLSHVLGSDGKGAEHLIYPAGGTRIPSTHESLDQGLNYLKMNGREVFKFATKRFGEALLQAIGKANLTVADIDLMIPHQANARIIEAGAHFAGIPMDKVMLNVQHYANTSAASVPIAFCEAMEQGRIHAGDTLALVAFGAGLTWASAVVKMSSNLTIS
jgi:3-oxoacyl-[acyl-carrier-protein] synthase-3